MSLRSSLRGGSIQEAYFPADPGDEDFNWPSPGTATWPLTSSKASPNANASAPHRRQLDETHQPLQDDTANPRWSLGRGNTLVPCSWQMTSSEAGHRHPGGSVPALDHGRLGTSGAHGS